MQKNILIGLVIGVLGAASGCGDDSGGGDKKGCEAGQAGCECRPGNECDDGLLCEEGSCTGAFVTDLVVGAGSARSCEVLLSEKDGARVVGVTFTDAVQGVHVREAPRTSVSFTAKGDSSIPRGAIGVLQPDGTGGEVEVTKANCFDAKGERIDEPKVSLGS